jgi:hypothetical protein
VETVFKAFGRALRMALDAGCPYGWTNAIHKRHFIVMTTSVAVIDYGMGNLHSVAKALEHVAPDASVCVTSDPGRIRAADRVVFPGVGAIRDCMAEIRRIWV